MWLRVHHRLSMTRAPSQTQSSFLLHTFATVRIHTNVCRTSCRHLITDSDTYVCMYVCMQVLRFEQHQLAASRRPVWIPSLQPCRRSTLHLRRPRKSHTLYIPGRGWPDSQVPQGWWPVDWARVLPAYHPDGSDQWYALPPRMALFILWYACGLRLPHLFFTGVLYETYMFPMHATLCGGTQSRQVSP